MPKQGPARPVEVQEGLAKQAEMQQPPSACRVALPLEGLASKGEWHLMPADQEAQRRLAAKQVPRLDSRLLSFQSDAEGLAYILPHQGGGFCYPFSEDIYPPSPCMIRKYLFHDCRTGKDRLPDKVHLITKSLDITKPQSIA